MVQRYVARRDEWTGEDMLDEHPEGEYVEYEDYAAMLAENERLKSRCSDIPAYRHSPDESGVMRPCAGGEWVSVEDYAGLREFYRNAGYTAADVATAAADGFRDGVRSIDLEKFRIPAELQLVAKKLKRFEECAEDSGSEGCDIGRDWFDVLTAIGLLERVQRSPAIWQMTAAGESLVALIDAHKGE